MQRMGNEDVGYARSRLLGVFSFFELSKADAAVLWSAMAHVDHAGLERVSIAEFAAAFCPESRGVFELLWDKYTWTRPMKAFKASVVHVDEDNPDDLGAMEDEEKLQGKAKERHLKAVEEHNRKLALKNTPTYAHFVSFILFFMATTEKTLPRWLYWLWFHIPKIKASSERIQAMTDEIWPKTHQLREKYRLLVVKGVKVVDEDFDAATFGIYNAKTGGAFSRPAQFVKNELYATLSGQGFWSRVSACVDKSLADFVISMEKLEDRKLKGTPDEYAFKGDRKQTRREMRKFLSRWVDYTGMKINEQVIEGSKGVLLPLIKSVLMSSMKSVVSATSKVDLTGRSDFVRAMQVSKKLEAWHKRRQEEEADSGRAAAAVAAAAALPERTGKSAPVPLEWKYKRHILLSQQTLYGQSQTAQQRARELVERVRREVVPAKLILTVALDGDDDEDPPDDNKMLRILEKEDEEEEEEEEEEEGD